jgi:membrane-associated protease RseP (regulator of RpoE activity)
LGPGSVSLPLQYGAGIDLAPSALVLFGLANLMTGLLSLVPLPPLPGGRLLFGLAPRTPGWQKAEYQLVERNIGIAVLLALLLIPLGGPQALLPTLLDTIAGPLVRLVTGG